ncbi:hypothetical protein [Roseibium sp. Sym1]|uniref:hypothetical protein n=1 Tax=Roseibium sp. Sym1 TaxID=3016006 RepID=UPI0022B4C75D|nr:hypothetical protein [Roseibium sp. Sym1]
MPGKLPKKPLRSVAGNSPLRSRGFLRAPDGQVSAKTGDSGDPAEAQKHHRSRGAREASVSTDGKPKGLSVQPRIRPYTLEEK